MVKTKRTTYKKYPEYRLQKKVCAFCGDPFKTFKNIAYRYCNDFCMSKSYHYKLAQCNFCRDKFLVGKDYEPKNPFGFLCEKDRLNYYKLLYCEIELV